MHVDGAKICAHRPIVVRRRHHELVVIELLSCALEQSLRAEVLSSAKHVVIGRNRECRGGHAFVKAAVDLH